MPRSSIIRCTSSISGGHFWISSMQTTVSRRSRASISLPDARRIGEDRGQESLVEEGKGQRDRAVELPAHIGGLPRLARSEQEHGAAGQKVSDVELTLNPGHEPRQIAAVMIFAICPGINSSAAVRRSGRSAGLAEACYRGAAAPGSVPLRSSTRWPARMPSMPMLPSWQAYSKMASSFRASGIMAVQGPW